VWQSLFNVVAKYSPKKFYELRIIISRIRVNWANHVPQKSLSLIIVVRSHNVNNLVVKKESMEVIEKFKKLGVVKKFEIVKFLP